MIDASESWEAQEGSYGHYIKVVNSKGKTVARIPWGEGDNDNAHQIAAAPQMRRALARTAIALRDLLDSRGQRQMISARLALYEAQKAIDNADGRWPKLNTG